MITAGIATVFFILAAYVEVAGFHYSLKTLTAAAGAPLFALGGPASAGGYGGRRDRLCVPVAVARVPGLRRG